MVSINFNATKFLLSAMAKAHMPSDDGAEVAFLGRSNVGKSSALNVIAGVNKLARVSKTPGRTQCINFFTLVEKKFLVDLPGYGYAKVPKVLKDKWQKFLSEYLEQRKSLCGLILLVDIRHSAKDSDLEIIEWALNANFPLHILLTKADKLSRGAQMSVLQKWKNQYKDYSQVMSFQVFSSLKKTGVDEVQAKISEWLEDK